MDRTMGTEANAGVPISKGQLVFNENIVKATISNLMEELYGLLNRMCVMKLSTSMMSPPFFD
jgi:hypothetical protein